MNKNKKNFNSPERRKKRQEDYAIFVKKEKYEGIVPRKLKELLLLRASQKKEMKKYEKGTSEYLLWDASQNATKILLNSFYGYSGDSDAKIYSWSVASAVTTNGRKQIKKTWNIILNDIEKAKRLLDWRPKVSIEEGIKKAVAWHVNNKEGF